MIHPVILCGGSGTRLWPASRKAYPKQFARLIGDSSLYQATLRRLTGPRFTRPLVMTNEDFRFLASQQAVSTGLSDAKVVVEPALRDTGPAILVAALMVAEEDGEDALMLVAPSDHIINDAEAFLQAVDAGATAAEGGALVTFGITPDRPETGYGYLELTRKPDGDGVAIPLASFREKPDEETAERFVAAGNYLWNGGIFLFRAKDVIAAFEANAPDLMAPARAALKDGKEDLNLFRLDAESYGDCPSISFDYAVMEKASNVTTVPLDCEWSDLGAWDALWQAERPDDDGLATRGPVTAIDCRDSYLRSESGGMRLVGLGLDGVVAVAMPDAVLVADKARTQEVKELVTTLREANVTQADDYPRHHRPWGWYETLCIDDRFQVKRIMVRPGGTLSLQSHHHRSEHWIVVSGTAEVTVGEDVKLVTENQSVYIPLGTVHRMANPGKLPMYLIEVQTGSYLGEDDIVRYEDVYGRS
ncbi:mannose-1-phosphate guanylyltransferase/mannose-6-phosphate isomerase [Tropicimonas isoalkanivorans]|uniref:mannose-1-phosphate guanylyltransferase n=1 Tax=Tropicimonas isoalkanivorans TaxID=441112 RepID=A0A1I1E466_9RHOB|nr:mannose-1-phosphate guanylyltransferase/mannose-6-phosphate isomerase [Tropicimonas isoalkanivorans]SFB79653.1 mannose-1-phosphate guanylyltransferase (GDP) /mannose-6-phosphate isomerase, type 2 [Tropicimonas isoalkanivorans]